MLNFVEDWLAAHGAELKAATVIYRVKRTHSDSVSSILVEMVSAAAEAQVIAWEDGRMDALVGRVSGGIAFSAHADFGADYQTSAAHFLAIVLDQMTANS